MVKRGFEIPHRMGKVPLNKNDSGYGGHSAWRSRSAAGQQAISKQSSKAFGGRSPLTARSNMSHLIVSPVTSGAAAAPFLEGAQRVPNATARSPEYARTRSSRERRLPAQLCRYS